MADPTYRYNAESILAGIEDIRAAHNRIDDALDRLETYATSQLDAWSGQDRTQYQQHKAGWDQNVNQMRSVMVEKAIPALQAILERYQSTERLNTKSWQVG